jgi:hypothetical protein
VHQLQQQVVSQQRTVAGGRGRRRERVGEGLGGGRGAGGGRRADTYDSRGHW